jgi:hypothetical protein
MVHLPRARAGYTTAHTALVPLPRAPLVPYSACLAPTLALASETVGMSCRPAMAWTSPVVSRVTVLRCLDDCPRPTRGSARSANATPYHGDDLLAAAGRGGTGTGGMRPYVCSIGPEGGLSYPCQAYRHTRRAETIIRTSWIRPRPNGYPPCTQRKTSYFYLVPTTGCRGLDKLTL